MRRGCEEMHHRQLHQKERSLALSLRVRCVWIDKALRKNRAKGFMEAGCCRKWKRLRDSV